MRVSKFSAIRILASSPDSIQTDGCCSRSRILVRTGCLVIDEPLMPKEVDDIDPDEFVVLDNEHRNGLRHMVIRTTSSTPRAD